MLSAMVLFLATSFVDARMLAPLRKSTALRLLRHLADGRNSDKMSLDIGGTLAKVLVFQPTLEPPTDSQPPPLDLGEVPNDPAFRDIDQQKLSVYSPELGGNLHFFVFETRTMPEVISFVRRHFSEVRHIKPTALQSGDTLHSQAHHCSIISASFCACQAAKDLDLEDSHLKKHIQLRATGGGSYKHAECASCS